MLIQSGVIFYASPHKWWIHQKTSNQWTNLSKEYNDDIIHCQRFWRYLSTESGQVDTTSRVAYQRYKAQCKHDIKNLHAGKFTKSFKKISESIYACITTLLNIPQHYYDGRYLLHTYEIWLNSRKTRDMDLPCYASSWRWGWISFWLSNGIYWAIIALISESIYACEYGHVQSI